MSIKEFINKVCSKINIKITWKENGINEYATWNNNRIIQVKKRFFRPGEVDQLKGNANKAKRKLNWKPKYSLDELIDEMIKFEVDQLSKIKN